MIMGWLKIHCCFENKVIIFDLYFHAFVGVLINYVNLKSCLCFFP